jgi:putative hemolysin
VALISTVQVGITAVGILTGAIGEPAVRGLLGGGLPVAVSFAIAFAIVSFLTIVFGELVPKALSLERAEELAAGIARPIELIGRTLRPIVWLLQLSAKLALRPFGIRRVTAGTMIRTADELRALVDEAESRGILPRAQEELLYNVFDFPTREAVDVMVPAAEVDWLDAEATPEAAVGFVIEVARTRFPVAVGSLDRLVGIVHVREIIRAARDGEPRTVGELARPPFVVPETKDLGSLLRELRQRREQLAVVVSEWGITAGIVTLEDVLEEIVGEIEGEYELPDARMKWVDERRVRVAGSMTIDDFNETTGTDLPQDGPRTLAGLVFDALGRAPTAGDRVTVAGIELRVEAVDGARISGLVITMPRSRQLPRVQR